MTVQEHASAHESASPDTGSMFGGLGPQEASRRAAEARRVKARARHEANVASEANASRSFRQRLGVALSKLTQEELDAVVARLAHAGNANALARLADQAFGRPSEQDDANQGNMSAGLATLSRDELAATLAGLDALPEATARPSVHAPAREDHPPGPPPTPARLEPLGGDFLREPLTEAETPLRSAHRQGGRMSEQTPPQEPDEQQEPQQAEEADPEAEEAEGQEGEADGENPLPADV